MDITPRLVLVTTVPERLAPFRPHLLPGLERARADATTWAAFDDSIHGTHIKKKFSLDQTEHDGLTGASRLFGQIVQTLDLIVPKTAEPALRRQYPDLVRNSDIRAMRRFTLSVSAVPSISIALDLIAQYGTSRMRQAIQHPVYPQLVLPMPFNRVIAAALVAAARAGYRPDAF